MDEKITYVVFSDVNPRDGIGLETYVEDALVMEIFRDDTEQRTYMRAFASAIDLDVLTGSVAEFNKRIDREYLSDTSRHDD